MKTPEQQNTILLSLVMALRQGFVECGEDKAMRPRGAIIAIDETLLRIGSQEWLSGIISRTVKEEPEEIVN